MASQAPALTVGHPKENLSRGLSPQDPEMATPGQILLLKELEHHPCSHLSGRKHEVPREDTDVVGAEPSSPGEQRKGRSVCSHQPSSLAGTHVLSSSSHAPRAVHMLSEVRYLLTERFQVLSSHPTACSGKWDLDPTLPMTGM